MTGQGTPSSWRTSNERVLPHALVHAVFYALDVVEDAWFRTAIFVEEVEDIEGSLLHYCPGAPSWILQYCPPEKEGDAGTAGSSEASPAGRPPEKDGGVGTAGSSQPPPRQSGRGGSGLITVPQLTHGRAGAIVFRVAETLPISGGRFG